MAATSTDNVTATDERASAAATTRPHDRDGWSGGFPVTYKDAFSQWWAGVSPAQTEYRVLSHIPYIQKPSLESVAKSGCDHNSKHDLAVSDSDDATSTLSTASQDPYGVRKWYTSMVKLSGKNREIHEFTVERVGEEVKNDVVILHGYGAGLGFFYKNFEPLSRLPGWRLHALDLLGMGRSSRPPFRIHAKDREGKISEAEDWFIDALEEWRVKSNIKKFTLLGHSLGGYMATAYALKYPGHLKKLVLISPVGIPEDPYAVNAELPKPDESTLGNEFTQNQEDIVDPKKESKAPPRRAMPKWFTYLWDANISPFSVVRLSGPFGPTLISRWTTRRFSHLAKDEAAALHDYSYSLFRQPGSGEYALAYILAPGAFARSPLIRRIQGVGRQPLPSAIAEDGQVTTTTDRPRENGLPVVLMYGQQDWMDVSGGYAAEKKLKEAREDALKGMSTEERRHDKGSAKVVIIKNAGHHLYLDGPDDFNNVLLKELKDVDQAA